MVLCLGLISTSAVAQGGPSSLEFSFSNPGARSLGFAGAFAALADDATAAFANPAGLVQLTKPEVSVEGRFWSYSTPFIEGGRVSGVPTGILLDDTSGLRTARSDADLSGVSFLSYVHPRDDWSLAFYRHVLARFESSRATQGFFVDSAEFPRTADFRNLVNLEIVSYSVAGAYRVSEQFSVGLGVSYFDSNSVLLNESFAPIAVTLPEGPLGPNIYDPRAIFESAELELLGGPVAVQAGFLWHLSRRFDLGGFVRQGARFDVEAKLRFAPDAEPFADTGEIRLPDVFGLGTAFSSEGGRLTISFEWDRVGYSTLAETTAASEGIELDDADELRLGAEYVLIHRQPVLALRGGVWLDPDHRFRFVGPDPLTRAAFSPGDDEVHFAAGLGLAFRTLQIDAAVDLSDPVDTASISVIYTF